MKGFYSKTKYNIYMNENMMILSSEGYAKTPKRIIELSSNDLVKWVIEKQKDVLIFKGLSLHLRKFNKKKDLKEKEHIEFTGESLILQQLKLHLCRFAFQSRIQDEYIIQAQIGKGNYARVINWSLPNWLNSLLKQVFSARHRQTGQKIAIKCFEKEALKDGEFGYECLLKEIKVMQMVGDHPHLIKFVGCYEGENTYYLAMNIVEGNSLYNEIKKRKTEKFSEGDIIIFMRQILQGVQHFHKFGIMHRDLKPENIMFSSKTPLNYLVIVDFGFAEFEKEATFLYKKCGTPGYVAPEVVNFKDGITPKYNQKCDIFSVGVIFHTLLFHQSVFYGRSFQEILQKNKSCKIDYSQKQYQDISPSALSLLKQLLEKDPVDRISSSQALRHFYFHQDQPQPSQTFRTQMTTVPPPTLRVQVEDDNFNFNQVDYFENNRLQDKQFNSKNYKIGSQQIIGSCQNQQGINSFIQNTNDNMTSFITSSKPIFHHPLGGSDHFQDNQEIINQQGENSNNVSIYKVFRDDYANIISKLKSKQIDEIIEQKPTSPTYAQGEQHLTSVSNQTTPLKQYQSPQNPNQQPEISSKNKQNNKYSQKKSLFCSKNEEEILDKISLGLKENEFQIVFDKLKKNDKENKEEDEN